MGIIGKKINEIMKKTTRLSNLEIKCQLNFAIIRDAENAIRNNK
jgi:hypothetical protein